MGFDARTPVPTSLGWKPASMLQKGDTVYSYDGSPTKVVSTQVYDAQECYKLWMQDGLTLIVDWRTGIPAFTHPQMDSYRQWTRKHAQCKQWIIIKKLIIV